MSRNYWCQKIVKGGWLSWIFWDPLNSSKIGCLTKSAPRGPIFKERYKCYTFLESSCQPLIGAEEKKVWRGQENWCQGLQDEKSWTLYLWCSSTFQIFEKSFSWQKINVFRAWKKILGLGTFRPPKVEKTAFFGIFLRKEGLNQKIALRKLVLEFNFMANRTLKK